MSTSTREKVSVEVISDTYKIVLFNDDVNTFDHVIETLVRVCDHEPLQAEQCALLVHYTGKCEVKSGELTDLLPKCSALLDAGLSAEIQ
jgi:ATP-dependent Clp protease adaptor protein ClpS